MQTNHLTLGRSALAAAVILSCTAARGQNATALVDAAGTVGRYLGPQALAAVITIEGMRGSPQPGSWDFRVADAASPNGIQLVNANASRATRRPAPGDGYPAIIPPAFFAWQSVRVESQAAFQVAEKEAKQAMIGFDAVHYLLRARDGTNHPVWFLTLIDNETRPVGRLEISAQSGAVERRVWLRYEAPGGKELLRIEDSASPLVAMRPPEIAPAPVVIPPAAPEAAPPGSPGGGMPAPAAPSPDGAYVPLPAQP